MVGYNSYISTKNLVEIIYRMTKLEIVYFLRILQKEILMIGLIFRPKMINCFQQGSVFPNAVFLQKNSALSYNHLSLQCVL